MGAMKMSSIGIRLAAFATVLAMGGIALAADPFAVTATTTSGTPSSVTASGSSVVDLVRDVVRNESAFSSLGNRDIAASFRYGGENNAIQISKNAASTSATVSIPSINFTKTFTGTDEHDLEKQIEDFAKRNGANVYGRFLRSLNEQTSLGVTDGNPLAATALLADQSFRLWGLQSSPFPLGTPPDSLDTTADARWRFDVSGGVAHTDVGNGYFAGGAITWAMRFGDRIGLSFSTPFTYRNVEGADIFNIGEVVSAPLVLVRPTGDKSLGWLVTPSLLAGEAGSVDAAAGGTFLGGGVTSALSYEISGFTFTLADQIDYFHGYPIRIGDWKFDTDLEQEVLTNGVKVSKSFGAHLFVDASIARTDFLQKAAIDHYWTPGAGVGVRFGPNCGLRVGYQGDFGHRYTVTGGDVLLYFNY